MPSTLPNHRLRKARNLLLWSVAGFFLLQLLTGLVLEQFCIGICDPEYSHHEKRLRQRIAEHPDRPVLVMFGSSRVANGFEAKLTQELLGQEWTVFNFGLTTCGPLLQQVCYDRLRSAGIRPTAVFFEVMPPFFHERPQPLDQSMLDGARLTLGEIGSLPADEDALAGPVRKYAFARFLPCSRYAGSVQEQLGFRWVKPNAVNEQLSMDEQGWIPVPAEKGVRRPDIISLAHRQYDACYHDFQLAKGQVQRMDDLIRTAQRDGVKVGLVVMPEGSEFRQLYSPGMTKRMDKLLNRWQAEFGVALIDGRDWLGDEWFYDMHHLTQTGATTFSNLFQQTVRIKYPDLLRSYRAP